MNYQLLEGYESLRSGGNEAIVIEHHQVERIVQLAATRDDLELGRTMRNILSEQLSAALTN